MGKVKGVGGFKSRDLSWSGETPVDGSGSSGAFRTPAAFARICASPVVPVIVVGFGSTYPIDAFKKAAPQPQLSSSESKKGQL